MGERVSANRRIDFRPDIFQVLVEFITPDETVGKTWKLGDGELTEEDHDGAK